jgi:hypothetical protein
MWKVICTAGLVLGLAGCDPIMSDSDALGIPSYNDFDAQREAELTGRLSDTATMPLEVTTLPDLGDVGLLPAGDAPTEASLPAPQPLDQTPLVQETSADATGDGLQPLGIDQVSSGGFSTENDFGAVAGQRSIEDDAERLARIRDQYQQVAPTAVPDRPGTATPNIVEYALATTNPVGLKIYTRILPSERRFLRNCATYRNADQAQRDFLARGGPKSDRRGLDPDGDGYACGWDPSPFRVVLDGANFN